MYQFLFLRLWRPSLSVISAAFIALGKSCLFANMRRTASLSSSSANILINSSLASPILSLGGKIHNYKKPTKIEKDVTKNRPLFNHIQQ